MKFASIYRILKLGKYPKVQNQVILALRQSMEFLEKCNKFIWWSKRIPSIGLCSSNSTREVILLLEVKDIPRDLFRSQPTWQVVGSRHDWQLFSSQSLTQVVLPYFRMTIPSQEETWLLLLPWFVVALAQKRCIYLHLASTYTYSVKFEKQT